MNKIKLEAAIAERTSINKKVVAEVLGAGIDIITESLAMGEDVRLTGFGTFKVSERKARVAQNPKTGARVDVLAKKRVTLKLGNDLKKAINPHEYAE